MNSVGIDVSKEKSMTAVMRLFGESAYSPFEVTHTSRVGDLCFSSQYNTGAWLRKRHIAANHDRQAGCHKAGKRWP